MPVSEVHAVSKIDQSALPPDHPADHPVNRALDRLYLATLRIDSCACLSCGARWDEDAESGYFALRVALAEAISNAILRGNGESSRKFVRVRATVSPEKVVFDIVDEGEGFDLDEDRPAAFQRREYARAADGLAALLRGERPANLANPEVVDEVLRVVGFWLAYLILQLIGGAYALRLDRGLSPAEVFGTEPGTHWDKERGLDDRQYIVPGGGGFGEIMNNAYV